MEMETIRQPTATGFNNPAMQISSLIESVIAKIGVTESDPAICGICFGSGMEIVERKGARPCECRKVKLRALAVSRIPERNRRNGIPVLSELKPLLPAEHCGQSEEIQTKIIQWQTEIIGFMQKTPFASINLCGKNKIGKSQIGYAVYLNAFENYRTAKCFKMAELLSEYACAAQQSFQNTASEDAYRNTFVPQLCPDDLKIAGEKFTVLIDEFHNVIPSFTEAQMRSTFEILDAIKANGHQLVLLSNFPFRWLQDAMYARRTKLGESVIYIADAIISRITEDAVTEELFF